MTNFIIIDNHTKNVIAELEEYTLQDIIIATDFTTEDEWDSDWFSVYFVGDTMTQKVAVFDDGNWYEEDGYTVLNY